LLEPQHYPDRRQYPNGPPERPYDVTAHTLPLLMGVTATVANDSLRVPLSAPITPRIVPPVPPLRVSDVEPAIRIGLYKSYDAAIDEGWTRWVFDNWKVPYTSLVDSVVREGKLHDRFDVIILPDQRPNEILDGLPPRYPAPYAGGIGSDGDDGLVSGRARVRGARLDRHTRDRQMARRSGSGAAVRLGAPSGSHRRQGGDLGGATGRRSRDSIWNPAAVSRPEHRFLPVAIQ